MPNTHRKSSFLAMCLMLMIFSAYAVKAQSGIANDVQLFRAGGRNDHIIIYPLGSEIQRDNVKAALDEAALYYQTLWGGASTLEFQIVVGFISEANTGDPTIYANAVYAPSSEAVFLRGYEAGLKIEPSVCTIKVFPLYESDPSRLSTLAHELAHCYQYYYRIGQVQNGYVQYNMQWWVEGTADWFASLVYPLQYPGERQSDFTYNYDVITRGYDNMFWWAFLASPQGLGSPEAVIAFLRSLPANANRTQYANAINAMSPGTPAVEIFHRWAFALLDGRAPFNPPLNFAKVPTVNASTPGSHQLSTERFSVDYATLSGFKTDPGNRAFLQVDNSAVGQYAVSVRVGGKDYRLSDGAPQLFCPDASGAVLIISRGLVGQDDIKPFTVSWGQVPSDTPCVDEDEEEEDHAECIVGEWMVVDYPPTIAGLPGASVDTSNFVFSFDADGNVSGTYAITASSDGQTVTVNVPFSGTYRVRAIEGSDSEFEVVAFAWAFETGGSMFVTARDGTRTDLSKFFYNSGTIDGWTPKNVMECQDDRLAWANSNGYKGFVLARR